MSRAPLEGGSESKRSGPGNPEGRRTVQTRTSRVKARLANLFDRRQTVAIIGDA